MAGSCAAIRLLAQNTRAARAILVVGLLTIVNNVPATLIVNALQSVHWGGRMAEYQSWINVLMYTTAFFATGPLGRYGDRHGNVAAVAVVSAVVSLPSCTLLIAGPTALGLTLWAVAKVLTGITGSGFSGSPASWALIAETSPKDQVPVLLGMGYAMVALFWMIGGAAGLLVMKAAPGSHRAVLVFIVGVSVSSWLVLASLRGRRGRDGAKARAADDKDSAPACEAADDVEGQRRESCTSQCAHAQPQQDGQSHGMGPQQLGTPCAESPDSPRVACRGRRLCSSRCAAALANFSERFLLSPCRETMESFRFACTNRSLCSLCGVSALVSVSKTVLIDLSSPFAYEALGLLRGENSDEQEHAHGHQQRVFVAYVCVTSAQVAFLVGSFAAGILAKRVSSQRALLWLIPSTAVLQSLPALLMFFPHVWAVGVAGAMLGSSLMVLPVLQAAVAQVAPPDRVSEAMGAVGAFSSMASLLGNLFVGCIVPVLRRSGLSRPLWVLFPACGGMTLLATLLVWHLQSAAAHGGGSPQASKAAGSGDGLQVSDSASDDASTAASTAASTQPSEDRASVATTPREGGAAGASTPSEGEAAGATTPNACASV